tara:strand:+ start:2119 stop:3075 length:957 start_codon:yes stop_codon:yes gene_type:complete
MTLIDLDSKADNSTNELGRLTSHLTEDGSLSLRNDKYKESFHSSFGAFKEAKEKFILPAELNRFNTRKKISILDVCFGLGYNSACLFEAIRKTSFNLIWWGLEIDYRPLKIALMNPLFVDNWSAEVLKILTSMQCSSQFSSHKVNGNILWGDARDKIKAIPKNLKFDLIFHDAFSPSKCPQLWSEEFLNTLSRKLAPNGRIITYSSSAAIRGSLKRAGLEVNSITPHSKIEQKWSAGTLAILTKNDFRHKNDPPSSRWHPLSLMEEEHLLTVAAIPYRDPSGNGSAQEILHRRAEEQLKSNLISSSSWRKRWREAQSS